MILLLVGLVLFLGIHLIPQMPSFKAQLEDRLGVTGYRGLHGVVALTAVVLVVLGYASTRGEMILWYPPVWTRHLAATLMLFASILVFSAPFSGKIKQMLISPLSVALMIWAVAHLLANGGLADCILFGFVLFFAISYRISIKRRIAAGLVQVGEGRWVYDGFAFLLGLGFYAAMILGVHEWAFGVSPLF